MLFFYITCLFAFLKTLPHCTIFSWKDETKQSKKKKTRKRLWIITQFSFFICFIRKRKRERMNSSRGVVNFGIVLFFSFVLWDFEIFFADKKKSKTWRSNRKNLFFYCFTQISCFFFFYFAFKFVFALKFLFLFV